MTLPSFSTTPAFEHLQLRSGFYVVITPQWVSSHALAHFTTVNSQQTPAARSPTAQLHGEGRAASFGLL